MFIKGVLVGLVGSVVFSQPYSYLGDEIQLRHKPWKLKFDMQSQLTKNKTILLVLAILLVPISVISSCLLGKTMQTSDFVAYYFPLNVVAIH